MKLFSLVEGLKEVVATKGNLDVDIKSLSQKADRKVIDGLFFCINGVNFDGHKFYNNAIKNGCIALVVERWCDCEQPQILVQNVRNFVPMLCKKFFEDVQEKLTIIGVTGTNGKTTTANLIYQLLQNDGKNVGLIGTNGVQYLDKKFENCMTTPDTIDLFYILQDMFDCGVKYVVMEVSAHALYLNKLVGIKFKIGVFTNFSQDHLDFFKDMTNYANAKKSFFDKSMCENVVVNIDDMLGREISQTTNCNLFTYGILSPATNFAMDINLNDNGTNFLLNIFDNVFDIKSNMICMFNVYNMLASGVCGKIMGVSNDAIYNTFSNVKKIDGRMNFYNLQNGAKVVVDYAHTPDSLEKSLSNLKKFVNGRLIVVFGCGGNRDKDKRQKMGKIASQLANFSFLTSDNPREESPRKIISQIKKGFNKKNNYKIIVDRKKAILRAIKFSAINDIVLIAGKGHEKTQEIKGKKYPFDDFEIIKPFIQE